MHEGGNISVHILELERYVDLKERHGFAIGRELVVNENSPKSLPTWCKWFIVNYHMHNMEKSLIKHYGMLWTAKSCMAKVWLASPTPANIIKEQETEKKKLISSGKFGFTKPTIYVKSEGNEIAPQDMTPQGVICYFCGKIGNWRHHACPMCLEELKSLMTKRN